MKLIIIRIYVIISIFIVYDCILLTVGREIDLLDWHNLLEVNVSLAKVLRVPNLAVGGSLNADG